MGEAPTVEQWITTPLPSNNEGLVFLFFPCVYFHPLYYSSNQDG